MKSVYDLNDPGQFKAWCAHYPKAAFLLAAIIRSWRMSKAKLTKDGTHTWAAYPLRTWCQWTGLKLRTLERWLAFLVAEGLIVRDRSQFAGKTVHTFIRPTRLALSQSEAKKARKSASSPAPETDTGTPDNGEPVDYVEVWQTTIIECGHLSYCVLTKTERHQLKEAVVTMPPEHVKDVIEFGLANWAWFVKYIESHTEEFNMSVVPSTKSFSKHANIFTSEYLNYIKPKPVKPTPKPTTPEEPSMTDEELEALTAEDD